jgi:hypothetical protein
MSSISKLEKELKEARNTLSADRLDMSFGELINMYDSEELIIDPNFQRLFRWGIYQRTRFIESILCGIPVPSMFVAEDTEGKWEVVDGLQRISTILSFFGKLKGEKSSENGWKMCQGDILSELNGKNFDDLPLKLQLNIKRSAVRIEAIKWDSRYDMRYELFNRLNTGGSPLTDQEIRNCVFRSTGSHLTDEIKELAKLDMLEELVKPSERQKSQLYLDELVLRFYALLWIEEPKRNLGEHLTDYMREASENRELYNGNKELFIRTLRAIKNADVEKVFQGANYQFSPSKYDGIMMGVASHIDRYEADKKNTAEKIQVLIEDTEFQAASGVASNYKERVKKRIAIAKRIFSNV